MRFKEAVKLMRKGKKLRREVYTSGAYCSMHQGIDKGDEVFYYYTDGAIRDRDYIFSVDDFESIRWEIAE